MLADVFLRIFDEQRIDVHDVPEDLLVVRPDTQRVQRAGDDVDEPPGELAERRAVALAGELAGDACGDLGDPTEPADGVVACRQVRMTEVEHVELVQAAGTFAFHVHTLQQVSVAFRVEDDHHLVVRLLLCAPAPIAVVNRLGPPAHLHSLASASAVGAANILGDEQLRESRLTHPRGAEYQCVADALAQLQAYVLFARLDAMEPRQTAHGRQRPCGVPGHVPGSGFGDQLQGEGGKLELLLQPARALVERRGLDVGGELGQVGICQALRMLLRPAKSFTDEQVFVADRHLGAGHRVLRQSANVPPVAEYHAGLLQPHDTQPGEAQRGHDAEQRSEGERPRRDDAERGCGEAHGGGVELHGRPQERFQRVLASHGLHLQACRRLQAARSAALGMKFEHLFPGLLYLMIRQHLLQQLAEGRLVL